MKKDRRWNEKIWLWEAEAFVCTNKTKLKEKLFNLFFFIAVVRLCLTDWRTKKEWHQYRDILKLRTKTGALEQRVELDSI